MVRVGTGDDRAFFAKGRRRQQEGAQDEQEVEEEDKTEQAVAGQVFGLMMKRSHTRNGETEIENA